MMKMNVSPIKFKIKTKRVRFTDLKIIKNSLTKITQLLTTRHTLVFFNVTCRH